MSNKTRIQRYYNGVRKVVLRKLNPTQKSIPGFIVGCGRSGTTMMVRRFQATWQSEVFNEDHPVAFNNFRFIVWMLLND